MTGQRRIAAGAGGKLLAAALALWLAWMIGQNVWRMVLPLPAAPGRDSAQLTTDAAAKTVMAANLFGAGGTASPAAAQASNLNLRLKGIYASQGTLPGFAILSIDGRPDVGIVLGGELKPGIKLHEVNADHILIAHDGVVERVNLATSQAGAAPGPAVPAALNVRPTSATTYAVSRSEFANLLSDPRQLATLAQLASFPGGGIIVNDATVGGLISKLGLRQGDIIQKINGQPVAGKDDLLRLAQQSPSSNDISVEGTRNGQPLRLTYNVQP